MGRHCPCCRMVVDKRPGIVIFGIISRFPPSRSEGDAVGLHELPNTVEDHDAGTLFHGIHHARIAWPTDYIHRLAAEVAIGRDRFDAPIHIRFELRSSANTGTENAAGRITAG